MIGFWIRPWPGEKLVGEVVALSGEHLICRAPGGVEFLVFLEDVRNGKIAAYKSRFALYGASAGKAA